MTVVCDGVLTRYLLTCDKLDFVVAEYSELASIS